MSDRNTQVSDRKHERSGVVDRSTQVCIQVLLTSLQKYLKYLGVADRSTQVSSVADKSHKNPGVSDRPTQVFRCR